MSLMDKILNKSNSYKHYKYNYKKLKMQNARLKKRLKANINRKNIYRDKKRKAQEKLGNYTKPLILDKILNEDYSNLTISIKSPNPIEQTHWGDLFFANSLAKSFENKGFNVIVQRREEWYDDVDVDINIVLRGLVNYEPNLDEINLMWNISHPDNIKMDEFENYDIIFVASEMYAPILDEKIKPKVEALLQCTNPNVFFRENNDELHNDILFVGSTRGVYRQIVKDVIDTSHYPSIYGMGWEKLIDEKNLKGDFIENDELHKYYSSCTILLNDHWEDMKKLDFPSNRLFDALACGTFVISDEIPSAETIFKDCIVTYNGVDDLNEKIDYYLNNPEECEIIAKKGKEMVLKEHTFDNRVDEIINSLKDLSI